MAAPRCFETASRRSTGQTPKWNFHKYVIDRTGAHVTDFSSDTEAGSRELIGLVERLLTERPPSTG